MLNEDASWKRWLDTCAATGHSFEDTGIRMSPVMREVGAGLPPITEHLEAVYSCTSCGKTAFERTVTCEVCDFYPAEASTGLVLMLPGGGERRDVPLCPSCHVAFVDGAGGVAVEWESPAV